MPQKLGALIGAATLAPFNMALKVPPVSALQGLEAMIGEVLEQQRAELAAQLAEVLSCRPSPID